MWGENSRDLSLKCALVFLINKQHLYWESNVRVLGYVQNYCDLGVDSWTMWKLKGEENVYGLKVLFRVKILFLRTNLSFNNCAFRFRSANCSLRKLVVVNVGMFLRICATCSSIYRNLFNASIAIFRLFQWEVDLLHNGCTSLLVRFVDVASELWGRRRLRCNAIGASEVRGDKFSENTESQRDLFSCRSALKN